MNPGVRSSSTLIPADVSVALPLVYCFVGPSTERESLKTLVPGSRSTSVASAWPVVFWPCPSVTVTSKISVSPLGVARALERLPVTPKATRRRRRE